MNEIRNENGEVYVAVSQFGEATITETGHYHVEHSALYEGRFILTSYAGLLSILDSLDKQAEAALAG